MLYIASTVKDTDNADSSFVITDADCSIEAHQHDESCYAEVLVCGLPELDGHHHTSACHHDSSVPVCGFEETDGHTHTSACFEKVLICDREVHIHSAACYRHDTELLAGEGAAGAGLSDPDAPGTPVDSASSASGVSNTDLTCADINSTASSNAVSNVSSAESSNAVPNDVFTASDGGFSPDSCMPTLEPLHFDAILTDRTGIYRNRKLYL